MAVFHAAPGGTCIISAWSLSVIRLQLTALPLRQSYLAECGFQ